MKGEQMSIRHMIHKVNKISFEYFNLAHSVGMDIKIITENDEEFLLEMYADSPDKLKVKLLNQFDEIFPSGLDDTEDNLLPFPSL
tara:strand:+ start:859 stop:1113 length:255 start_codon:yes stop_codon:yes gene_type:complete